MLLFSSVSTIFAQQAPTETPAARNNLFCTDNFALTNIKLAVTSTVAIGVPQTPVGFTGSIENQNSITVPVAELRARVFQIREDQSLRLVDTYVVEENIILPAQGKYSFADEWVVPENQPMGDYAIQYVMSFMGETAIGLGYGPRFTIASESEVVQLDHNTMQINGQPYESFDQTIITDDQSVTISVAVINATDEDKVVPIQWNQYLGPYPTEDSRLDTKSSILTIAANSEEVITYTTKPTSDKEFLVNAIIDDRGAKSIQDFQFLKATPDPRILVAGVRDIPLSANQSADLFYCIATPATAELTPYRLSFELTDPAGLTVASVAGDSISDASIPSFVPPTNQNAILLTSTIERDGVPVSQETVTYDCDVLGGACHQEPSENITLSEGIIFNPLFLYGGAALLLVLLILVWIVHRREYTLRHNTKAPDSLGPLLIVLCMLGASVVPFSVVNAHPIDIPGPPVPPITFDVCANPGISSIAITTAGDTCVGRGWTPDIRTPLPVMDYFTWLAAFPPNQCVETTFINGVTTMIARYQTNCPVTPLQPTTPTATPQACGTGQINVSWSAVSGATSYQLRNGAGTVIYDGPSTSFSHTGLANGSAQSYTVRATNSAGSSAYSGSVNATTPNVCPPATPTGLNGTPSSCGTNQINLTWNSVAGASGYDIQINGAWQNVGNVTSFTHTAPLPNSLYTYRVRAWNGAGAGAESASISRTSPNICAPTTPTTPTATPGSCGTGQINVSWNAVSGATSYQLRNGAGTVIYDGPSTSFSHTGLANGSAQSYTVRAINAGGSSAYSGARSATAPSSCGQSDVIVPSVSGATSVNPGSATNYSALVRNQGTLSTGAPFNVRFWFDTDTNAGNGGLPSQPALFRSGIPAGFPAGYSESNANVNYTFSGPGTYYLQVCADISSEVTESNEGNNCSGWTTITVTPATPATPATPTATPQACGTGQINVSWSAVSGATSYQLRNGAGTVIYDGPSTSFSHTGLANGSAQSYTVRATNSAGSSAYSGAMNATAPVACATAPAQPATPTATPGSCGTGAVTVSWSNVTGATGYDIQFRLSPSGGWTIVNDVTSPRTITGLNPGSTYDFQVRAKNAVGNSAWSAFATANAPAVCAPPAATTPTGLTATPQACGTNQLFLDWNDSTNAASYSVYLSNGTFVGNSVGSNYTFTGSPNTSYSFYVRANNAASVQSGNSSTVTATTPTICAPATPTGLTATPQACGTNQLFLDWNDVPGATSYSVYYSNGTFIANSGGSNYTFTGGTNTSYSFYVRANNAAGQSPNSSTVTRFTPASCPTLPDLRVNGSNGPVSVNYNTGVSLTWTSTGATPTCTLSGAGITAGSQIVTANGSVGATITQSSPYILTCGTESDTVQVNLNAQAPNAPTVNFPAASTAGVAGTPVQFRIVSTHPNPTSQFYYTIDWQNNGSNDTPSPSPTYTTGQQWTINNTWLADGTYTVRACARDIGNTLPAACTNHTVTITLPPPPSVTLQTRVNGTGAWLSSNPTINPGDTIALRWTSVGASSCTATAGSGFSTGGSPNENGTDNSVTPPVPGTNAVYTVSCTGLGGTTDRTVTVTTRNYPNLTQPDITYNLSPTFNSVTGMYDYIDIVFQTRNDGESDTLASANYELQFDRSGDGYEFTTTGSLGLLTVGSAVNRTERVTGSIPFGAARTRVFVDSTNTVTETNEGDNSRVFTFTIPPPDPGLNLTADRYRVKQGETITLTWSTAATYPMNCRVYGPGVDRNPSGTSGTEGSGPINAKSLFTFSCTEPVTNTTFTDSVNIEVVAELEEI